MFAPIITKRNDGEYSTVMLSNGVIETMFFPIKGESRVVGRTSISVIAQRHILGDEND